MTDSRSAASRGWLDGLLVMAAALASCAPYVADLGFYNDDWFFFARYENASARDLWSLVTMPMEPSRPVSGAYHAVLYWLFGNVTLGYHLTNALVLTASAGIGHAVLRRLGVPPGYAFALTIVWITLPHAATGRFWYSIYQMQASIALALASLLCELRSANGRRWMWRGLALLFALASGLSYEVALPLLALTPLVAAKGRLQTFRTASWEQRIWWLAYPLVVSLLLAMKVSTTNRLDATTSTAWMSWFWSNLRTVMGAPNDAALWGFNIWKALEVAFLDLGARLPSLAWESGEFLGPGLETGVALAVAAATFLRLWRRDSQSPIGTTISGLKYIGVGVVVFLLGWLVFLGSSQVQLTATGVGNRTAGVASIGVAFVFVGLTAILGSLVPSRIARVLFALLPAISVLCGTLVIHRIARDWTQAWLKQQQVLEQIAARFPDGFAGRTLLLDGVCQYVGPASVFEASWDLQWALQARYKDPSIRADVVTSSLEIRDTDLRTTLYGEEKLYRYGSGIVYRPSSDIVALLANADDARRYFATWNIDRDSGCPPSRIGRGVDVFTRRPRIAYLSGFYEEERDEAGGRWRWMDTLGIVSLKNDTREMVLSIRGRSPEQAGPQQAITLLFNGRVLETIEGSQPIDRQYTIPISEQQGRAFSELRIRAARSFDPAAADPASPDRRRLSFQLYELTWEAR